MKQHHATKEEYSKLVEIWARSVEQTHDFLTQNDFHTIKKELPTYFPHLDVQIWTDQDRILGFSGVDGNKLEMLFLDPAFIGKGYGKQILTRLMSKNQLEYIDVNEQNTSARAFYRAMGFESYKRSAVDDAGRAYPILHLKKLILLENSKK